MLVLIKKQLSETRLKMSETLARYDGSIANTDVSVPSSQVGLQDRTDFDRHVTVYAAQRKHGVLLMRVEPRFISRSAVAYV